MATATLNSFSKISFKCISFQEDIFATLYTIPFSGSTIEGTPIPIPSTCLLRFTLEVNGQTRQTGDTRQMLFTVDRIIAAVSRYMTLRMGDLIYTGTPAGVGPVSPGDNLRAVLEGRELLNFDIR